MLTNSYTHLFNLSTFSSLIHQQCIRDVRERTFTFTVPPITTRLFSFQFQFSRRLLLFPFLAHSMSLCNREASVVRPSVCLSVNFAHFYHRSGWIATKLEHDGPQKRPHPGCAQGQGRRSRDTGTSMMSRNVYYIQYLLTFCLSMHSLYEAPLYALLPVQVSDS